MTRALFVNSGLAGHRTYGALMRQIVNQIPEIDAQHIDLNRDLTLGDRLIRRLFSLSLAPRTGPAANLDLRRWRQELNVGCLAARRIASANAERHAPFDVLHFYTQPAAYASISLMKRVRSIVCLDCTQRQASLEATSRLVRASYYPNLVHDGCVFRAASAIVATSAWAARDVGALYPDCASKVTVLPCPVDLDAFGADWIEERAERATAKGYRPRVLFIGGDFPRKGGPELLDAWREGGLVEHAELDMVTDWPLARDAVPSGVNLIGGVAAYSDRWRELWRQADVFAMPARHEAFGIVYEEAAASGIPAIGSNINAVPELIQHGETGLVVSPGDRAALVHALRMFVGSSELRQRMGRAARQYVSQRAALRVHAATLRLIISTVVKNDVRQSA